MIRTLIDDEPHYASIVERADMRVHTWIVVSAPVQGTDPPALAIVEPWPLSNVTYRWGASSWTPEAQQDLLAYFTQGVDLPWTGDTQAVVYDDSIAGGINSYIDAYGYTYLAHADVTVGFAPTPSWVHTGTYGAYPDGGSTYALGGDLFIGVQWFYNGSVWGANWGGVGLFQPGSGRTIAIGGEGLASNSNGGGHDPLPGYTNLRIDEDRIWLHLSGDLFDAGAYDPSRWSSREGDIWTAALGVPGTTRPAPRSWYMALYDYATGLELDPAIDIGYARQSIRFGAITPAPRWPGPTYGGQRGYQVVSLDDVEWSPIGDWRRVGCAGLVKGASAVLDAELPQLACQYIGGSAGWPAGSTVRVPAGIFKVFVY